MPFFLTHNNIFLYFFVINNLILLIKRKKLCIHIDIVICIVNCIYFVDSEEEQQKEEFQNYATINLHANANVKLSSNFFYPLAMKIKGMLLKRIAFFDKLKTARLAMSF